jgi:hypothetical protein
MGWWVVWQSPPRGWAGSTIGKPRRGMVDRRTATLMYAGRNRRSATRRKVPLTKYRRMEVRAWWSCGLGELLVVGQATKQAVEVGLGIAPVERYGGLLVAVLEAQ